MALDEIFGKFTGKEVVVDYKTHSGAPVCAKGLFIKIEERKLFITSKSRFWLVDVDAVVNIRVKLEKDPRKGYLAAAEEYDG